METKAPLAKTTYFKFFGGLLKKIDPEKLDIENRVAILSEEKQVPLCVAVSPIGKKRGKLFYRKIFELFFVPILISIVLFYFSITLVLSSEKTLLWKAIAILPILSSGYYIWATITALESRSKPDQDVLKYIFLFPLASIGLAVVSFQPGFYLSSLFFMALGLFLYEEFLYKDALWIMSKKVLFWRLDDKELSSFLIISEKFIQEEKKQ